MNRFVLAIVATGIITLLGYAQAPEAPASGLDAPRLGGWEVFANTRTRLGEIQKLAATKPAEAADDLRRLIDTSGDDLVSLDGKHHTSARQIAFQILFTLPAAELRGYRDRVDEPARKLLEAGKANRDPRPLRLLVNRYFPSRHTEEALFSLGELAFERGEFRTAKQYWLRLLPGDELSVPDAKTDPALIRARVILAMIFDSDIDAAKVELMEFKTKYPTAKGKLAGVVAPYEITLQRYLDNPPILPTETNPTEDWTSFGGNSARNGRVNGRLPKYWPSRPTWKAELPGDPDRKVFQLPKVPSTRAVGLHPVVMDGVGYVADACRVFGFDIRTGEPRYVYDFRLDLDAAKLTSLIATLPIAVDADFTLTTANGKLYARLGATEVSPPLTDAEGPTAPSSYLVCFTRSRQLKKDGPWLDVVWKLKPPVAVGVAAAWEGSPVCAEGRLYAAFTRESKDGPLQAIACYTDTGNDEPGKPLWVADVAVTTATKVETRHRPELLTFAAGKIVLCSHTGFVMAVDTNTGKPAWAFAYPRLTKPATVARDICPPIADGGRLFVAPTDTDKVFALDINSGQQIWMADGVQVDQLLGVMRGKLIATIAAPTRGIRGFNVINGSTEEPSGWMVHDDPNLMSFGRGLVSEDAIIWPTKSGLFLVRTSDGLPLAPRIPGPHGNLAFADGVLLVATPTEVWGYVSDRVELPERKAEVVNRPADPVAARQLALALADAEQWPEAQVALRNAEPAVDAPRLRAEWLHDRAERLLQQGQPDDARTLFKQATAEEYPQSWRVRAYARLVTLEPRGGGEEAVKKFTQAYSLPPELSAECVRKSTGVPMRLQTLILEQFGVPLAPPKLEPTRHEAPKRFGEFDPLALSILGPDATIDRTVRLANDFCVPLQPLEGVAGLPGLGPEAGANPRLFVTDGTQLFAYRPTDEKPTWAVKLPTGLVVTHGVVQDGSLIACGSQGVLKVALANGSIPWSFVFPDTDPLPSKSPSTPPRLAGVIPSADLSNFTLAGSFLIAQLGTHHLLAINTLIGEVAWVQDTLARERIAATPFDNTPRFAAPFYADEWGVMVQLSSGKRWLHRTPNGASFGGATITSVLWESPPVRFAETRLAVADGAGTVGGLEIPGANPIAMNSTQLPRTVWSLEAIGETSLTGRPPQLTAVPNGLLVAWSRNHGVELERLQANTGNRQWIRGVLLPIGEIDLTKCDTDGQNFYAPAEGQVFAIRLKDGGKVWKCSLTASAKTDQVWRVRAGPKAILVYPTQAMRMEPWADVSTRVFTRFLLAPTVARLPGFLLALVDATTHCRVPITVLDPDTGRVLTQLELPAFGPAVGAHFGAEFSVIVTAGRAHWLKSP